MKLYLDDDSCGTELAGMLRKAGHDVVVPANLGTEGAADPVHLLTAIEAGRAFLTRNYMDFEALHDLVVGSGGTHPGILLVRLDNNRAKDMRNPTIVAVGKLEQSGLDPTGLCINLNDYR